MILILNHSRTIIRAAKKWAMIGAVFFFASTLHAQGGIGINADGASPLPAAVLDVDASALPANNQKGLLIPAVDLHSLIFSTASIPSYPNPFLAHGPSSSMPHSLWIYNEASRTFGGTSSQYGVNPNFYWWEPEGLRWIKQELQIGPTHHHASTNSVALSADGVYSPIPGMSTVALDLRTGDRVIYSAHGSFEVTANTWANAGALLEVDNGAVTTQLQRTGTSVNTEIQALFNQNCFLFGLFCSGVTPVGYYTTHMGLRNWRLMGEYVVPANGNYTFSVKAARIQGSGVLTTGGSSALNPNTQGALKVEVFRP